MVFGAYTGMLMVQIWGLGVSYGLGSMLNLPLWEVGAWARRGSRGSGGSDSFFNETTEHDRAGGGHGQCSFAFCAWVVFAGDGFGAFRARYGKADGQCSYAGSSAGVFLRT